VLLDAAAAVHQSSSLKMTPHETASHHHSAILISD
jgi:hypothetical protein